MWDDLPLSGANVSSMCGSKKRRKGRTIHIEISICGGSPNMMPKGIVNRLIIGQRRGVVSSLTCDVFSG